MDNKDTPIEEKRHYISFLVEGVLFKRIEAMKDDKGKITPKLREDMIKVFIEGLPEYLSDVPDKEQLVQSVLEKTETNIKNLEEERKKEKSSEER